MSIIDIRWDAAANTKACFTTRRDGFSKTPYDQFNLAAHVGDDPEAVKANRQKLVTQLNLPNEPLWLEQCHGTTVVKAEEASGTPTADASYTTEPGQVCAVLTADCLPILIGDKKGRAAAAIHAGWRGLLNGVIENTLKAVDLPGEDLIAWFGPAISQSVYEVDSDLRDQFITEDKQADRCFLAKGNDKWMANIYDLAKIRLKRYNISQINGGTFCTYQQSSLFYSYRRDNGETGRIASLIWLTDSE